MLQDPNNLQSYLANNIFLPDVNNEHTDKKAQYADNLASLQRLVLYRFADDTTGESCICMCGRFAYTCPCACCAGSDNGLGCNDPLEYAPGVSNQSTFSSAVCCGCLYYNMHMTLV